MSGRFLLRGRVGVVVGAVYGGGGDAEVFAHLEAGLGDEKGAGVVEELDGLDLVLLVHKSHRLAHQPDALLNELVQQVGHVPGDVLRLLLGELGGGEAPEGVFHGQHEGDVVVDGEDADGLAVVVPEVDGAGLEDLAVLRLGEVAQPVLRHLTAVPQGLQHHMGGSVPHPAAGHVAVFNGHDGGLRVVGGQVVDHHLTVGAELPGDALGQLEAEFQVGCLHSEPPFLVDPYHYYYSPCLVKFQQKVRSPKYF